MNTANLKSFQLWSLAIVAFVAIVALLVGCDNYKAPQQNPVPALTSISPTTAVAGGAAFTLTTHGTGLLATSVVNWNGSARPTTYVSATQLSVAIPASDIATAGTVPVIVTNPTPGSGSSAAVNFTITSANNPSPTISSLSPTSVTVGGAAFTLTVSGTNYINSSVVNWNGSARTSTLVSATQITAAISAADIATAGTAQITVTNPAPGGGTSPATGLISSRGRYVVFDAGAPIRPGDYVGEVFANDTCTGVASGCTPSVKGISFDVQGHVVSGVVPVSISADGHFALLLDNSTGSFNLYLALTGY